MVAVESIDLVKHVPAFEPLVADDARRGAIVEVLRPAHVVVMNIRQAQGALAFEDHSTLCPVESGTKLVASPVHGVEEYPIRIDSYDHRNHGIQILDALGSRAATASYTTRSPGTEHPISEHGQWINGKSRVLTGRGNHPGWPSARNEDRITLSS